MIAESREWKIEALILSFDLGETRGVENFVPVSRNDGILEPSPMH